MKNLWCHPRVLSSSPVRQAQDWLRRGTLHLVFALFLAFFFVACSDDDSGFATRPSDGSSSSVCEDCDDGSSSSVTPKSNDSETSVSSSSTKSSSSSVESSSSSQIGCKTETEDNCEYGELLDDRDGQTYKTVKIGDQWWMAENLNYAYIDDPFDSGEVTSDSTSWCYDNVSANCNKYGRLYTWSAAMDSAGRWSTNSKGCGYEKMCSPTYPVRGVCPEGWHLPNITEWEILCNAAGGKDIAGKNLKSTSGWDDYEDESGNGTDSFGFTVLPAGSWNKYGISNFEGISAFFWSSTEDDSNYAYEVFLLNLTEAAALSSSNVKNNAFPVRCIKD